MTFHCRMRTDNHHHVGARAGLGPLDILKFCPSPLGPLCAHLVCPLPPCQVLLFYLRKWKITECRPSIRIVSHLLIMNYVVGIYFISEQSHSPSWKFYDHRRL